MLWFAHTLWPKSERYKLPRELVPSTPLEGHEQDPLPGQDATLHLNAKWPKGVAVRGVRQQPQRHSKKPRPCAAAESVSSPVHSEADFALGVPLSNGSTSSDDSCLMDDLTELSFDALGFTDQCLSSSNHKRIFEVSAGTYHWSHSEQQRHCEFPSASGPCRSSV